MIFFSSGVQPQERVSVWARLDASQLRLQGCSIQFCVYRWEPLIINTIKSYIITFVIAAASKQTDVCSVSTGVAVAIAIVTLVVLGAIAAVVGFIWKKRQGPVLPRWVFNSLFQVLRWSVRSSWLSLSLSNSAHTQTKPSAASRPPPRLNKGPPPSQHTPMPMVPTCYSLY